MPRRLFPIFLILYECTLYLSNDLYLPAFPTLMQEFNTSSAYVHYTMTSWLAGDSIAQLLLGPYSDRIGRRPIIIGASIVFILSCLGCIWVKSIIAFIVMRFIQGMAVCSVSVAGYAAIHESFSDKAAVKLISCMSMAVVLTQMVGPLAGGYIVTHCHWHTLFVMLFFMATGVAIGLVVTMPETLQTKNTTPMTWKNVWIEYSSVLKHRDFMTYTVMFGLYYAGTLLWASVGPFYFMLTCGFSPKEFGMVEIPVSVCLLLGTQLASIGAGRLSLRNMIVAGMYCGLFAAIFMMLTVALRLTHPILLIIGMSLYGLGFGIIAAPMSCLAFQATVGGKGVMSAVYGSCMLLLGSMMTIIMSRAHADNRMVWFSISMVCIMLLNMLGLYRKKGGSSAHDAHAQ